MPFLAFFIGFPAALLAMFGGFFLVSATGQYRSLDRGAPEVALRCNNVFPTTCTEYSVRTEAHQQLATGIALILAGIALWPVGFRERYVSIENETVRITWGERFAIPLRQYQTKDIASLTISLEKRFTVSRVVGTSVNRVQRAPDRWRMRGTYHGKPMNLGSYATQLDAQKAKERIIATQPDPEAGIYHYGRT
jgi:hypothetical protein